VLVVSPVSFSAVLRWVCIFLLLVAFWCGSVLSRAISLRLDRFSGAGGYLFQSKSITKIIFFTMAQQPPVGQGLLIIEDSWSHSDTQHSEGLLTTSDQPLNSDLYLTTHNNQKRQASMSPAGFEPAIPASKRPQTHALDRAATGIGTIILVCINKYGTEDLLRTFC
jgi:hypothetical protein